VGVVPAGVHHTVHGGGERKTGHLLEGQRIEIRAQRDAPLAEPDIADQPGAAGERARLEPRRQQMLLDQLGGVLLGAAELGEGVHRATQCHHVRGVCLDP
jgi:hypothetical protein